MLWFVVESSSAFSTLRCTRKQECSRSSERNAWLWSPDQKCVEIESFDPPNLSCKKKDQVGGPGCETGCLCGETVPRASFTSRWRMPFLLNQSEHWKHLWLLTVWNLWVWNSRWRLSSELNTSALSWRCIVASNFSNSCSCDLQIKLVLFQIAAYWP